MTQILIDPTRMIPGWMRHAVISRDGLICRLCGTAVTPGTRGPNLLHLDHVTPWAEGGETSISNLRVTCARCNLTRPRPTNVTRRRKIRVEHSSGIYWWADGYVPPRTLARKQRSWAVSYFKQKLGLHPLETLRLVIRGDLAATSEGPIRVEIPPFVLNPRPRKVWEPSESLLVAVSRGRRAR